MSTRANTTLNESSDAKPGLGFVVVVVIIASLGGLLFGYDTGVIAGANGFLKTEFHMTAAMTGLVSSSIDLGAMVGVLIAGFLGDKLGRKKSLMVAGITFVLCSLITAFAGGVSTLVIGRFLGGVGIGLASLLSPLYIAEIAPAKIRGRLVGTNQLAIVSGIFIVYFVNAAIVATHSATWNQTIGWRWMFSMGVIPGMIFFLLLFFVPESPRYLVTRGRDENALSILARVNGVAQAKRDIKDIRDSIQVVPDSFFKEVSTPGIRKALGIGILLAIFQQFTGTNAVGYYAPMIFKAAGAGTNASFYDTVLIGAIKVLFVIVLMVIVDRVGRKRLLVWNGWFMALFLAILGVAFALPHMMTWLVLGLVFLHTIAYELSWGGGVWIVLSEIYPTSIRGRAMSIASFMLWFATYLVAQFFPILLQAVGGTLTFWIFAVFCIMMALFMKKAVPETSGKTMERIQADWVDGDTASLNQ
ncbi:sugar porter family MFS transporter [Alicyclobacillus fastidiosus]|uniref:Sugar porter family MFS transporter n=1 Tax=Alicyclobacillus fastidiosus TaxID=392011 RepID=A0ABY6ZEE9_9BACL|nr:sugar porter family MFS transporter [Alicyclobacillus fastidiosus]WAH41273.1 sugar porter family MFS transporter [Alicyclobacillus fastidiosus]GMA62870.1 arabinose-proton symporter [Alicyclobacillus fastidiosus]